MRSMRLLGILLLAVSFAACGSDDKAAPPPSTLAAGPNPFTDNTTWIAYQSSRNGPTLIWLVHPDGSDDHAIEEGVAGDTMLPDWSPDGTKLVFDTRGSSSEPLYEYDLATETSRQLFECERPCFGDSEAAYSPDGTKVVFVRSQAPFVFVNGQQVPTGCGLAIGDVATGEVVQITSNGDDPCSTREKSPRWSPDGSKIAYFEEKVEGDEITTAVFVVNADGSNVQQLTEWDDIAGYPDWSPDGEWIVYATHPLVTFNHVAVVSNLYRMHPDGSNVEQLTFNPDAELRANQPRYTPDGQWILFTAVTEETRSIWAIPADGGQAVILTSGSIYTHPTWQPTG